MLFSVEQVFVGRDEIRAPLKTPLWKATVDFVGHAINHEPLLTLALSQHNSFLVSGWDCYCECCEDFSQQQHILLTIIRKFQL